MIGGTITEGNDGRTSDGIADKNRHKNKLHVHQHPVCRHAVVSVEILEKLEIIQHTDQRGGDVAHQFGGTVAARLQDGAELQARPGQAQAAPVGEQEVHKRHTAADTLADTRSNGGACNAPSEDGNEQCIQHHIGNPCRHRDNQSQLGLFGGYEEALEHILEHEGHGKGYNDASVADTVVKSILIGAQKPRHRLHENKSQSRQDRAQHDRDPYHHGECPVGALPVPLPHDLGNQRRAAGSDHEAHAAQHHNEGHDKIDCGEGLLPRKIGHEQTVHHTVDGSEHHHDDGREHEAQQFSVCEMIRQADLLFPTFLHVTILFSTVRRVQKTAKHKGSLQGKPNRLFREVP